MTSHYGKLTASMDDDENSCRPPNDISDDDEEQLADPPLTPGPQYTATAFQIDSDDHEDDDDDHDHDEPTIIEKTTRLFYTNNPDGFSRLEKSEEQQMARELQNAFSVDQNDEHSFVEMIRPSLFNLGGFTKLPMTSSTRATTASAPAASRRSVTFTHDEVYDEGYEGDVNNEDNEGDDEFQNDKLEFQDAKDAESKIFSNATISDSHMYCFMVLAGALLVYMICLMLEVEIDDPDPVIQYIANHTKLHTGNNHGVNYPNKSTIPLTPTSAQTAKPRHRNNSSWEHVFEHHKNNDSIPMQSSVPLKSDSNSPRVADAPQSSQQDSRLVGFIDAPPELDELALLMEKIEGTEGHGTLVDDSLHHEINNDHGDTIHCGIQVDGKLVTLECLFDADLCRVYLGERDCESLSHR